MNRYPIFILLALAYLGCGSSREGAAYKAKLADAIQSADRILVTEHSCPWDFPGDQSRRTAPDIEYGGVELDQTAKAAFLKNVSAMNAALPEIALACEAEYHHSIFFYSGQNLSSTMNICFKCNQIQWDVTDQYSPAAIFSVLARVIEGAGFKTERDWEALAKKQRQTSGQAIDEGP